MSAFRLTALTLFVAAGFAVAEPNNYADPKSWLCRPGGHDACEIDLSTTVVAKDGKLSRETWSADASAPIDCFYVYPTVSTDTTPNSDMNPDPAELNVIRQQFARFGSKCRRFAPMYRQVTLAGLRTVMAGGALTLDRGVAYDDVLDAWKYYLAHDNGGRGFVLIGHSQGSFILQRLVREEIDGKPIQSKMVSAILAGATLEVPKGKDVGGTFQKIPLCKTAAQLGCVIAYSAFRSTVPPPAGTLFGKAAHDDMAGACVSPTELLGATEPHAYLDSTGRTITATYQPKPWLTPEQKIETPWITVAGLLSAKCASNENATYLEITTHADPSGKRTDDITGDIMAMGRPVPNWGLHLIDMNLVMGDLVEIVGRESKAYTAKAGR
jgi:hypothetical protein